MDNDSVLRFTVCQCVVQRHFVLFGGHPHVLRKLKSVDDLVCVGESGYSSMVSVSGGRSQNQTVWRIYKFGGDLNMLRCFDDAFAQVQIRVKDELSSYALTVHGDVVAGWGLFKLIVGWGDGKHLSIGVRYPVAKPRLHERAVRFFKLRSDRQLAEVWKLGLS